VYEFGLFGLSRGGLLTFHLFSLARFGYDGQTQKRPNQEKYKQREQRHEQDWHNRPRSYSEILFTPVP
jgi:hypothetical protein